jgi:hypothetical protein
MDFLFSGGYKLFANTVTVGTVFGFEECYRNDFPPKYEAVVGVTDDNFSVAGIDG